MKIQRTYYANPQDKEYCGDCPQLEIRFSNFGDMAGTCLAFNDRTLTNKVLYIKNEARFSPMIRCEKCKNYKEEE